MAAAELMRLRYPAKCNACRGELPRGSFARWDREAKAATCEACLAGPNQPKPESAPTSPPELGPEPERAPEIERGTAGASATREWQRRHERRETGIRDQHKHLGGLLLALSSDPPSTTAWATGAQGEQAIGRSLDLLREDGVAVLHDRRIPGSKANIDHLVISQAGIFVVDTKHYKGRVEQRNVGGLFRPDIRLYVGGRDRSKLLAGMTAQVEAVGRALADKEQWQDIPVTPALLFMSDTNWSLFDRRPLRFGSSYVLWGKALGKLIRAERTAESIDVTALEHALATALPAA